MYTGRECFLCGRNGCGDPLDKHHIFNGAYRDKSERYGLTVYLCHNSCHENGPRSVHRNAAVRRQLQRDGQMKTMLENDWETEDFVREFGKNYLNEVKELEVSVRKVRCVRDGDEVRADLEACGFRLTADELPY